MRSLELGALRQQAEVFPPEISVPAIIELALRGEPIEIYWWKKQERIARVATMSTYLCCSEEGAWVPDFEKSASRFKKNESKLRQEELDIVRQHKPMFAGLLKKYFLNRGATDAKLYKCYSSMAGKIKERPDGCTK